MMKKATVFWLTGLLPALLFGGTTGKIAGTVTDLSTGQPLIGANVIVEGTTLGAVTDADGDFAILNVPVGAHAVRARYIGYKETLQQNIRVSVDLTSEALFRLEPAALAGETVVITAERKMIRKDETNTNIIRSSDEISVLPIRGMQDLSASVAGVVKSDNNATLNIRGGRGDESAIYVDGVLVNDPYNFAVRAYVPNEAIEEISVQTGGFNAEYGEAMSGIIIMTTNSGTQKFSGSVQAITDGFLDTRYKNSVLKTYGYGFNEYTATLGGPVIPGRKHTFFGSATRQWMRDGAPSWGWAENRNKPAQFQGGTVPGQEDQSRSYTGKVHLQLMKNLEMKSSLVWTDRTYSFTGAYNGMNPIWLYNVAHAPQTKTEHRSFNATLTHLLRPTTYYDLKFNYFQTFRSITDRMFQNDLKLYGDPTFVPDPSWANNTENYGNWYSARTEPDFFKPGAQYDDYFKNKTVYWGMDFDLTHQAGKHNTLKTGFDYKYHTLREMRVLSPYSLAKRTGASELELYRAADVQFYGYDIYGNEANSGSYFKDVVRGADGIPISGYQRQEPYHPVTMSGYAQDKIELQDLVLNIGLRYDRIDPNAWQFRQIAVETDAAGNKIPGTGMFGGDNQFDETDTKKSDAYGYISPRLGFSFPVSDMTLFHAQYGKFYQKPSLMDLYLSPFYLDNFVQGGYFTTIDNPNLRPEKTTGYELGFNQLLGSIASLQLTAFYKETEDLIQVMPVETDTRQIAFTQNGDFGVVKGFDVIFTLRRFNNMSASVNYEYQTAKATGSATNSNYNIAWLNAGRGNYPKFTMPLDFQQTHRGAVNLDYRLAGNRGPSVFGIRPLEQAGVNLMFSFNSGQPFTRMLIQNRQPHSGRYDNDRISTVPVSAVNSVNTPWNYRFDLKVDKTLPIPGTPFTVNAYLWVMNLFNTENVVLTWNTGEADQTGYLQTEPGKAYYESLTTTQRQALSMREMDWGNYGIPRQIRLGMAVSF